MALALRPCQSCGRPELPAPSDVPPSETLRAAMVEVLRFSQEFIADDPNGEYSIEDFVDWLAMSAAVTLPRRVGRLPLRSGSASVS